MGVLEPPPLSISLAGLSSEQGRPWSGSPKRTLAWVASVGARWVHLDGARPGMRARELDRSARRDLGATLRRAGIGLSGLDLWIPPAHFVDPEHQARAVDAVLGAVGLGSELMALAHAPSVCLSLHLPAEAPDDLRRTLTSEAERAGVRLANHAYPVAEDDALEAGLDPATVLIAGASPLKVAAGLAGRLASARLSDADQAGRVPPGEGRGRLDVDAYAAVLATVGYDAPIVLDLRGLGDAQEATARDMVDRFAPAD